MKYHFIQRLKDSAEEFYTLLESFNLFFTPQMLETISSQTNSEINRKKENYAENVFYSFESILQIKSSENIDFRYTIIIEHNIYILNFIHMNGNNNDDSLILLCSLLLYLFRKMSNICGNNCMVYSFISRYLELLIQYEAVSYGDETFGSFLVLPLQQNCPRQWKKLLLTEHSSSLSFLRVPFTKVNSFSSYGSLAFLDKSYGQN